MRNKYIEQVTNDEYLEGEVLDDALFRILVLKLLEEIRNELVPSGNGTADAGGAIP